MMPHPHFPLPRPDCSPQRIFGGSLLSVRRRFVRSLPYRLLPALVLACALLCPAWSLVCAAQATTIAVIQDGPSWLYQDFDRQVETELAALLRHDQSVHWLRLPEFNADWNLADLPQVLRTAQEHPDVDIIFSLGILTTALAARPETRLYKPVVGGFIPEAAALDLPYGADGHSTRENLAFVVNPDRILDDLRAFHRLTGFARLHVLVDEHLLDGVPRMREFAQTSAAQLNVDIHLTPMGAEAKPVLDALPSGTQAVYITPALDMPSDQRQALIQGLNRRNLPTFALRGRPLVEQGVLAGLSPDDTSRFARRIALNIQQLLLGRETTQLPVVLHEEDVLVLNARTAERIRFSPTFAQWIEAVWVDEPDQPDLKELSLEQAMLLAGRQNISLDVERSRRDVAALEHDRAGSRFFPRIQAETRYQRIDADRAEASMGLQPRDRVTAGASLRQIIFDDAVISAWKATGRQARARELELTARRLDVLARAGQDFLHALSAQAMLRIDRNVLDLTRRFERMAQTRRRIGLSGPEDVFRWESEMAQRKSALYKAQTRLEQARLALNQTLGLDTGLDEDSRWELRDIALGQEDFYFLDNELTRILRTVAHWDQLESFFVDMALDQAPELQSLEEVIAAQEIQRNHLARRFTTPSLHARLSYDRELDATRPGGDGLPIPMPQADRNDWSMGVALTLPLFEGGGRVHELHQADARLRGLLRRRDQARQVITRRIKSALYALQSSHPNIRLSREAARLAHENLSVVQDKYARGRVHILDLLDAQNQVAVQDQAAALAVYTYLGDLVECQRALSWFEADKSQAEKQALLQAMSRHLDRAGTQAP